VLNMNTFLICRTFAEYITIKAHQQSRSQWMKWERCVGSIQANLSADQSRLN